LARAERQWRNLKEWKWFGFGHTDKTPGDAELAFFCPTCPQPGVNLPEDWKTDEAQWKYQRSFAMDGNFVAVHQQQLRTTQDVWIKDGEGYMTRRAPYYQHLRCTAEIYEVHDVLLYPFRSLIYSFYQPCTCNEHRAHLDRAKAYKGCDCSGIGAFACLRHGCFCPGSIVNFQKGEQQRNMDYGHCKMLQHTHTEECPGVISCYDVHCQYHKKLHARVAKGQYLSFRPGLRLVPAIGLFHVHGHQNVCYARYAPRFIPGAALADGEVMERLFSVLNGISTVTRTMTLAHRSETLDSHMGDSNFKKMIDMGKVYRFPFIFDSDCVKSPLCAKSGRKFVRVLKLPRKTIFSCRRLQSQNKLKFGQRLFNTQRKNGEMEILRPWMFTIWTCQEVCAVSLVVTSLSKNIPVIPQAEIRANLMAAEQGSNSGVGITSWLVDGMSIQETQYVNYFELEKEIECS